jgi:hypothetical protein
VAFVDFLAAFTAVIGGAVSLGFAVQLLRARKRGQQARDAVRHDRADEALRAVELKRLGDYLFEDVGKVKVRTYVDDADIRGALRAVLEEVSDFVASDPETADTTTAQESEPDSVKAPRDIIEQGSSKFSDDEKHDLEKVRASIDSGEFWDALARLRRLIERRLARLSDLPSGQTARGAGRLLRNLVRNGTVPQSVEHQLGYAISVANRGVHGEEVERGEVEEALHGAIYALSLLENPSDLSPTERRSDQRSS